jgi:hypothetical protein
MNQIETEQQYVERRLREENTERFRKEFQQAELLRIAREKREAQEAKDRSERQAREKIETSAREARAINSDTETCLVCGTDRVPVAAICHFIYGTDSRCIRKPRAAKATGQLTEDQWDMLTDVEKRDGFIIEYGAGLRNVKVLKDNTPELISGAPNCYGQKLF